MKPASSENTPADLTDEATSKASKLTGKAKAEAAKLADKAKSAADEGVETAKAQATSRLGETAAQIRNAGHEFGSDSYQAQAADYVADSLLTATDRIQEHDLDSLTREASAYARRNPALVLGGAALLGFAVARLLKASDEGGRA